MDFKTKIYKTPLPTFFLILIFCWALAIFCISIFIYNIEKKNGQELQAQLLTFNRFVSSLNPIDSTTVSKYCALLTEISGNESIIDITTTVYDRSGKIIMSNAKFPMPLDFRKGKNVPKVIAEALNDSSAFSSSNPDPVTQSAVYHSAIYNKSRGLIIASDASYSKVFFTASRSNILWIVCSATIILSLVSATIIHLIRGYRRDFAALHKILYQLSHNIPLDESHKFITPNIRSVAKKIFEFERSKASLIEQQLSDRKELITIENNKLKSKRILSNNLNHEVKTPIGIIQGYLDTLLRHPDIKPELQRDFLIKCSANIQRLQNMVYNITLITRIEDGNSTVNLEEVNIRNISDLVQDDLLIFLRNANMEYETNLQPDIFVKSNETILYNIINNLMKNSCLYSHGTKMSFDLISAENGFYTFCFQDNGNGVDSEFLPFLFQRFCRIDRGSNPSSGSGLGLAIVKESIELCGGSITAENKEAGGLEYTFTLPIA